jgi:integrase
MIKFVFRPKRVVRGRKKTARLYSGRYQLDGEPQMTEVSLKTTDKQVAKKLLDDLVKEKEQERAGIIPASNLRQYALQPMEKHLTDYLDYLRNIGRDDVYVENLGYRLNILIRECGWLHPPRVTPDSFTTWRAKQKKATETLNQYLDSANAMLNWMVRQDRIAKNPMAVVEKLDWVAAWKRRALRDNEVRRLLEVAGESRIGYKLALYTGLRRAELKALTNGDFKLDADVPSLSLDGRFTKNGKTADIPLHPELVNDLRGLLSANDDPSAPFLTGKMLPSTWKMKKDLKRAGIEYENDKGRVDFHSLRHTLATNLAIRNIAPRVAMEILRHSDIRLTMNHYTDASLLPLADAIRKLPAFGSADSGCDNTQIHPQTPDILCNPQSPCGTPLVAAESSKVVYPEEFWHDQTPTGVVGQSDEKTCLARIRT